MATEQAAVEEFLSLDDVAQVDDVRYKIIDVPDWGKNGQPGKMRIGSLSAQDLIEFAESNEGEAKRTAGLRLIIKSIVDGKGRRTGTDKHLAILKARNAATTNFVVEEILKLNELNPDKETASAAAAARKNG